MHKEFYLTGQEYWLVQDPELFYTKNRVIEKVYSLFGLLSSTYSQLISSLPPEVAAVSPKMYKGENYRLLPYVMLDHPRFFRSGEAFAIRSFFWWGQHFSIHLVLGGKYKIAYQEKVFESIRSENFEGWYIAFTNDPWQHHFNDDNYLPVEQFNKENISADYLKIGKLLPLDQWNQADEFFINAFAALVGIFEK